MANQHDLREHALRTHRTLHHQQAHASSLQTQLQALKTSLLKSTAAEQVALAALAKSECAQLCNLVMTHLPRELRDMVYQHLVPSTTRISREYFRSIRDPISGLHTYDAANWKAAHYREHYWDASYVGAPFLHELTQIYFLTSTFAFGDDDGLIDQFLTTDLMNVGYAPAELVSRVEVYLNAMTYDRTTCVGYMFGCATKPERLVAALRGVEGLKEGASLCVHFETRAADGEVREKQIGTVCDAVRPCLREVEKKGCKVRLVVDKKTEIGLGDGAGECKERGVDVLSCEPQVKVKSV